MEIVKAYKTVDGRMFNDFESANKHERLLSLKDNIINLLGGSNSDIGDGSVSFTNGEGVFYIDDELFTNASSLITELKAIRGLEKYDTKSRICYEDEYMGSVSNIMSCIVYKDGKKVRVVQPYFASHFGEVGSKVFCN